MKEANDKVQTGVLIDNEPVLNGFGGVWTEFEKLEKVTHRT
jgi:hypothetical protein